MDVTRGQGAEPVDFSSPFTRLFRDPEGRKALAIGSLCWLGFFLLFPPLLAMGWGVAYSRKVAEGSDDLPSWDMSRISDGFRVLGIYIVYFLPVLLITIPIFAVLAVADSAPSRAPGPLEFLAGGGAFMWAGLSQIYGLAVSLIMPAATAAFIGTGQWAAAFSPAVIRQVISPHGWVYLGVAAIVYAVGSVSGVGLFLCIIGVFFTIFYSLSVGAHFVGQLARSLRADAAWPPPPAA